MKELGKIIFKLLGWSGLLFLFGILGIIFAIRDSSKNIGSNLSFDFKMDILFIAVGFIGGTAAAFFKTKRMKKAEIEADEHEKEAALKAKSDPKYWNKPKTISPEKIKLKDITDRVRHELSTLPMIPLIPQKTQTSVFDSKLGGIPYMPKDFGYPTGKCGSCAGKPLRLLAQLNFESLPHISGFPEEGILQFFCSCGNDEGLYGLNSSDPCGQNGFRVIYHENIITDPSKLMSAEEMPFFESGEFPFEGEYILTPHAPSECTPTTCDFRFDKTFAKVYSEVTGDKISSIYEAYEGKYGDGSTLEDVFDFISNSNSCIGGYPDFTQTDPRNAENGTAEHTVLLFQLESYSIDGLEIMWGDSGVANFFITPDDLKNKDFSRVMFNWDCF
ncbi:MAG: YwqG family protein [Huintestinicola sp.]